MKQLSLTIFELIYLGNLTGKYMHAVPNVYSELSEHDASESRQAAMDSLLAKGFIEMDFDGEITISQPILEFVQFCTECDGYVLASRNGSGTERNDMILWRKQNAFMHATLQGMDYQFSLTSPLSAADQINGLWFRTYPEVSDSKSVQITQLVLKKAKRLLAQNEYDAAERVLTQSRVDPWLSQIILDALSGVSDFYSILFVDMHEESATSNSFVFSAGRFGCLQMCPVVDNYRSAAVFTLVSPKEIKAAIRNETINFIHAKEV